VELVSLLEYDAKQGSKQLLMSLGWTQQIICQLRRHHFPEDVDLKLGNKCTVKKSWFVLNVAVTAYRQYKNTF
jgi:hypothetical protein